MFAIQPSSNMDGSFDIEWQDSESALGISEQLYTAKGSQSIGTNSAMTKQLFVDLNNYKETVLLDVKLDNQNPFSTFKRRVLWTTSTH